MATTYRYLAVGDDDADVLAWFLQADPRPALVGSEGGNWLHFRELGSIGRDSAGAIDVEASPLVGVIPPRRTRGVLWTAGEVHFTAKRLRRAYPPLERVRSRFHAWLRSFDLVWDGRSSEWAYSLEGSIQNYDSPVYALPRAMTALRGGAYFVADDDSDVRLDKLCKELALPGTLCTEDSSTG